MAAMALAGWVTSLTWPSTYGAYTVERVVGGLNQPIHMAQAPGDNASIYVVERTDSGNVVGRIRKYDLQSQSFSTFLDLPGAVESDGGLLSLTFHPQFQSNGLFYIVTNLAGDNRLDEYRVDNGTPTLQRRLLQYNNLENVFHTMNQVHFRPGGSDTEIFVTAGDGGTQANEPEFDPALIESLTSPYGKLLKIDLTHNFPTPASAPGPGTGVSVVARGIRNPYRSGFDRQTGDFYFGDVGFSSVEEIDFIPASHFSDPSPPVLDFGWTEREGTIATPTVGVGGPGSPGDINPILDYAHSAGIVLPHPTPFTGQSITSGFVYRGPVAELQGRLFFSDFTNGNVYSGSFDTNTPVANYNGTNVTGITNHTLEFEALIGGGANIRNVTSFAEDNVGNLYIVKFGNSFFPPLGQGEIFRIAPVLSGSVAARIDRETGAIEIVNTTGAPIVFSSYTLTSAIGALGVDDFTPVTGNYDSTGNDFIDGNDPWQITSPANSRTIFREGTTGDAGALPADSSFTLAETDGWIPSPYEDVFLSFLLGDGTVLNATVEYSGNGGEAFAEGDLNFDGAVNANDWSQFLSTAYSPLPAALSRAESYPLGDLDGDGDADFTDFRLFKDDYDAANGVGAFEAMVRGVPEPGSLILVLAALGGVAVCRRRPNGLAIVSTAAVAGIATLGSARDARADLVHRYSFTTNANDSVGTAHGTVIDGGNLTHAFTGGQLDVSGNSGQTSDTATLTNAYVDLPDGIVSAAAAGGQSGALSVELWATVSATRNWQRFFDFGLANGVVSQPDPGVDDSNGGSMRDYFYIAANSGRFNSGIATEVHQANQTGASFEVGTTGAPPLNTELHVVGTYNHTDTSAGANGTMRLYVDGVSIGSAALPPAINLNTFINKNNWLGRSQFNDPIFDGKYNEFRIYDHAMTAGEVTTSFTLGPNVVSTGPALSLEVNKNTGSVRLRNHTATDFTLDFYRITSAQNALSPGTWNTLDAQNVAAVDGPDDGPIAGDSPVEGWARAAQSDSSQLVEFFLGQSGSVLPANQAYNLGAAFSTAVFGVGVDGDLQATVGLAGGSQLPIDVTYVTTAAPGDFDGNGRVDGNDFMYWQTHPPVASTDLAAWRGGYGLAVAANTAVPEPAEVGLLLVANVGAILVSRRLGRNNRLSV